MLSQAKHLCVFQLVHRFRFDPEFFASLRMTLREAFLEDSTHSVDFDCARESIDTPCRFGGLLLLGYWLLLTSLQLFPGMMIRVMSR